MNITESIKFHKVKEENEILKKELAEKDRKIDLLLTANREITYSTKSREYNQPKLFKEDFEQSGGILYRGEFTPTYKLKDSSKYDTLPSKEDKTCI